MCGIFFALQADVRGQSAPDAEDFERLKANLRRMNAERGPDSQSSVILPLRPGKQTGESVDEGPGLTAEFYGAELRLRGESTVQQPHQKNGNILCWNGEIFGGLEISALENDGVKLLEELGSMQDADDIVRVFGRLEGPYSFVYYHATSGRVYFARDPLGRRSLLIHKPTQAIPAYLISSVSSGDANLQFEEVSTDHIYYLDLSCLQETTLDGTSSIDNSIQSLSRCPDGVELAYASPIRINDIVPPEDFHQVESLDNIPEHLVKPVDDFLEALDRSTWIRVRDIPRIEGQDANSARVSVLFSGGIDSTIVAYLAHRHTPLDEPIDLFNVGFENPRKIKIQQSGNMGALPKRQKRREMKHTECTPVQTSYRVPDRVTGLQELEELRQLCPGRTWNFVEVNVPYEETQSARKTVETLMLPSRTVMDLSLALALYFAARGKGQVRSHPAAEAIPYTSPARVVLSGLGSDELLGGYGRHRTAYTTGGWPAVIEELQLEIDRIPTRNLGRDDRMVSSHGKETRHPFLSLDVVSFLANLPVHLKMDPRAETGVGDKMLLRLLTRKLGLMEASSRKKRAMQFGSHSARMDGEKKGDVPLAE